MTQPTYVCKYQSTPPPPPPRPLGFASDYWAVKNVRMLLIMFLKIYIFFELLKFY